MSDTGYHESYLRRVREDPSIRPPIQTRDSLAEQLDRVEEAARQKLEAQGYPGDYFRLGQRLADSSLEASAKRWKRKLKKDFSLNTPRRTDEAVSVYVKRLRDTYVDQSLERSLGDLERRFRHQHKLDCLRAPGESIGDYSTRLQRIAHQYGLRLDWEWPVEEVGTVEFVLENRTIPENLEKARRLFPDTPEHILTLRALLYWILIARCELAARNSEDVAYAMYYVGRCAALAGLQKSAVTAISQGKGWNAARGRRSVGRAHRDRGIFSEYEDLKATTKETGNRIVERLTLRYDLSESTVRRAIREQKKLLAPE